MPKIDRETVAQRMGSSYPPPYDTSCRERVVRRLGEQVGLTQFGVNLVTLPPGTWASQRHWHAREDEFAFVLQGVVILIEDEGETELRAGDCAGWPAGVENGHHLVNRSNEPATFLVVGTRDNEDHGEYPDIDLVFGEKRYQRDPTLIFRRKDGTPY